MCSTWWRSGSTWAVRGLLPLLLAACSATAPPDPALADPGRALVDALGARPGYLTAHQGLVVLDPVDGRVVVAVEPDRALLPASTAKLFTAALALRHLAPGSQFETTLWRTGPIKGGVLEGDLVLRGGGDPSLGAEGQPLAPFRRWGAELFARGLRAVTGRILADDDLLAEPHRGVGWTREDLLEPYGAPFGALVLNRSLVDLVVVPPTGPGNDREVDRWSREHPLDRIIRGSVDLRRQLLPRPWRIGPLECPKGMKPPEGQRTLPVPVRNPSLYAAVALRCALEQEGIAVRGGVGDLDDLPRYTYERKKELRLAGIPSPPLNRLLRGMLHESRNLDAENLWRLAGLAAGGGDGDPRTAVAATRDLLAELGLDRRGLHLVDGSGLSRLNQVTPRQVAGLLAAVLQQPWGRSLPELLPLAGSEGTLRDRFRGLAQAVRIRAKTGTLERVSALAGYLLRPGRPPLAFAWIIQGQDLSLAEVRADQDRGVADLVDRLTP